MTKILIYGGCHAQIFHDYLVGAFDPRDLTVDLMINFQLIRSEKPFPFDRIDQCDVFIYSPIENRGAYNTTFLEKYCRERGKMALCYPWIEWHGYCPGAVKGLFKSRHQWYYPDLLTIAQGFDDFPSFRDYVGDHFPSDDTIDTVFALTSDRQAEAERRHDMSIRLSDYIDAHYRDSRLFFISDHPSRRVYLHALQQILDLLGLKPHTTFADGEPQGQCRTPIFPRVASRLRLDFDDTEWADDVLMPGRHATLEEYLRLYFYEDGVVLAPLLNADLVARSPSSSTAMPLNSATRVLAAPVERDEPAGIDHFQYLATLAGPSIALDPQMRFSIESKLWRETWENY